MQINNVDALLTQPVHTALGVDGVADNHLAEAELEDEAAAVPARRHRGDQNRVMPGGAAAGSAKGVGLSMQRTIAFLHQAVVAHPQQGAIYVEDRSAHWNAALRVANAGLLQGYRQHALCIHARSLTPLINGR